MKSLINLERILALLIVLAGLGAILLSITVEVVGIGDKGFGPLQIRLVLLGFVIAITGIGFLTPIGQRILTNALDSEQFHASQSTRIRSILVIAVSFGLLSGLVEGIELLLIQKFAHSMGVWTQIVWISAFFNALLFGSIGILLSLVSIAIQRLPITLISVFLFAFMATWGWISIELPWELHPAAILILSLGLSITALRFFASNQNRAVRIFHRSLPILAGLTMVAFVSIQSYSWIQERLAVGGIPELSSDSPDILIIVADTLRADHLASYGYERPTSPNIDQLAKEGVLFETPFATSSWTAPSHASLLTGTYPNEHGVVWTVGNRPFLETRFPTIAQSLRDSGYHTGAFSANTFWFTREQGFGRGFVHFEDFFHTPGDMVLRTTFGRNIKAQLFKRLKLQTFPLGTRKWATDINDSLLDWVGDGDDRPFFAFVNYFDVHDPYVPPQPYRSMFSDKENPGGYINSSTFDGFDSKLNEELLQDEIDAYDGSIVYLDAQIGLLMDELKARGLDDNLIVVFTSDHGEAFGEHGTVQHANSLYREEIHVPLIIWQPGQIPAGIRISQPVSNAALPVTLMEMIGQGDNSEFPRRSLVQLWQNTGDYPEWPLPLAEMEHRPWKPSAAPSHHSELRSLISSDYHYIENVGIGTELYDWNDDPEEVDDLSQQPEGQSIQDNFKRLILTVIALR